MPPGLSGFLLITTAINAVFSHSEERTGVQVQTHHHCHLYYLHLCHLRQLRHLCHLRQQPGQDHYYLEGKATGAKLPSYDDCIKADKDLLIDITNQGRYNMASTYMFPDYFTKEKFPFPTFVVLDPVVVPAAEAATTSGTAKDNDTEA